MVKLELKTNSEMITKLLTLTIITVTISAFPLKLNEENSSLLAEDGLFEGDLKITESLIRAHYNLSEMDGLELESNRSRRAVANNVNLWVDGIVPYVISSEFSSSKRAIIRDAMDRWEDTTCLRFVPRRSYNRDYIYFQNSDRGCYSYVGRQGGGQVINLERNSCETYGITLHEIAHAIGFWHEQSRPDRDDYVRIIFKNIKSGQSHNFMKRKDSEIDSFGSPYDYGSIMHYSDRAFVKSWWCFWCKTIEVANSAAYRAQGSPRLGRGNDLSRSDIQQANLLYSCPVSGVYGILTVKVRYGRNLKDTDGWWNLSDPYVEIIAVDYLGSNHRKTTNVIGGTLNPTWNKTLRFSLTHWQFFRIKVWDSDNGRDDAMSMSETVIVSSGHHNSQKHCHDTSCVGYIMYDYSLLW